MSNSNTVHPIFSPSEFFVKTPMAVSLKNQLNAWLQNGATGAVILGPSRAGKSRAIEYASQRLVNRLEQPIPARSLTIHRRTAKTETSIFRNLCLSLSLKPKSRANTDDMSDLVFHHFCDLAQLNDTKQVVLFVDEVHRLTIEQLEAFCEIYDKLVVAKVNISIFFIGNQNSCSPLLQHISLEKNELIRGRFFTRHVKFTGLRNVKDVRATLSEYDSMRFPTPDGPTFTSRFLAEKCGADFNLRTVSEILWEVFNDDFRVNLKIKAWPMQYFVAVVRMLLVDYLPTYGEDDENSLYNFIHEAIEISGLVPDLVSAA